MRKSIADRKGYWASVGFEYVINDGFLYFAYISSRHESNRLSPIGYIYRTKRLRNDDWVVEDEKRNKYRLDNRTFSYIGSMAFNIINE